MRTKLHFIIMFIGAAGVGVSIYFEAWNIAAILAVCTIGTFIYNAAAMICEKIESVFSRYIELKKIWRQEKQISKIEKEFISEIKTFN